MRDEIFFGACFGFLSGVFARSFSPINLYIILAFSLILLYAFVHKRNRWNIFGIIFLIFFTIGIVRFNASEVKSPSFLENEVGSEVILAGVVLDEPEMRASNQKVVVRIPNGIKVLLSVPLTKDVEYGDEIKFAGKLEKPENFITDQGKEFDYINYLRKDRILYSMYNPDLEIISRGNGNFLKEILFKVKNKFLKEINSSINNPESLLLGGLVLGERAAFDSVMRERFITTGTIHIVALSGYNITIVAEWMMKALKFLPSAGGMWAGIITIIFFILMTGANSTAIRAGIMAGLAIFARSTGRNYEVSRGLLVAAVMMVLLNPMVLAFDVSFQLSFIATIAVIFFTPKIEKYFYWVPEKFGLRDVVSVTSAAYVFVLPFILYKMGNLSLVAIPANALILPFIPLTMLLGFITGLFGIISNAIAFPFGVLSYLFLHYELKVIEFFSTVPFASFALPNFPLLLTLVIYAMFTYWLFGKNIKEFFTEPF